MVLPILSSTAGILIALKAAAPAKELFMKIAKTETPNFDQPLVKAAKTLAKHEVHSHKPPTPQKREEKDQEQENRSRFIPTLKPKN